MSQKDENQLPEYVVGYIEYPRETYQCELKPWIDPIENEYDKVKIAKACLALKNWGGGVLLIGITNDGKYEDLPDGYDPSTVFTQDSVQAIVSAYSAEPFGVDVHRYTTKTVDVVSIVVPGGITTPMLCKKDSPKDLYPKLSQSIIYTRTLKSNGIVSSARAVQTDLEEIVKKCHNNRVADIGKFLREHLTGENLKVLSRAVESIGEPVAIEDFASESSEIMAGLLKKRNKGL